ncbi:MAG: hypothetical protein V1777_04595 [Candidatus Micrarchaeota archaeon]
MLDFILSKLNLLIMVTAIFAIVAYFSFFVDQSVVDRKASQILSRFAEDTRTNVNSQNLCNVSTLTIPPYLCSQGCGSSSNRVYFKVRISKIPESGTDPTLPSYSPNTLVYSLLESKAGVTQGRVLASQPYQMKAQIRLFSFNPIIGSFSEVTDPNGNSVLDPQSAPSPTDSILLVKETFEGNETLFVVPCSSDSAALNDYCNDYFDILINGKPGGFIGVKNEPGRNGVFNCSP